MKLIINQLNMWKGKSADIWVPRHSKYDISF